MKSKLKTCVLWLAAAAFFNPGAFAGGEKPLHVLFVGNSYTAVNSLPDIFGDMAVSAGVLKPIVGSVTPGGYTLFQHSQNASTKALVDAGAGDGAKWDVVVLQEQSQYPALAERFQDVREPLLKGAADLFKYVVAKNPSVKVVFFETWARHPDIWKSSAPSVVELGSSATDMQRLLGKWTTKAARSAAGGSTNVAIARVGDVWQINYESAKPIRLHGGDGSHPSFAGSYLAGLVIFAEIYGKSPHSVSYSGSLSEGDAKTLKTLAANH